MTDVDVAPNLAWLLGTTIVVYVLFMYGLGFWAQRQIHDTEDFLLAGRKLPLSLAWATLLATWFGAGSMLTAADEVRAAGLSAAALDPLGAGSCLLIAGLFFAAPLWRMGLFTLSDYYGRKFGPAAEVTSALIMVPSYFGWIAAQFIALANMLHLFFGLPVFYGILIVAAVGMGYTLLGGMWSVTLTDAVQICLVLVGLVILGVTIMLELGAGSFGAGIARLQAETPPERLTLIPRDSTAELVAWLGVFLVGALGNVPGQDLTQRIFSARSASVARWACLLAGAAYLLFGMIPVMMGLSASLLFPADQQRSILPALAHAFLSPAVAVVFIVVLMSAVLSTIDSAILSPASVLAQNLFPRVTGRRFSSLTLNRVSVLLVTLASVTLALLSEGKNPVLGGAYELLEGAYSVTLTGLFVPLAMGLLRRPRRGLSGLAAMIAGAGVWLVHYLAGWDVFLQGSNLVAPWQFPSELAATLLSLIVYLACDLGPAPTKTDTPTLL